MLRLHLYQEGLFSPTACQRMRASGVKWTARRRIDGTGHVTLEDDSFLFESRIGNRNGGQQRLGIGMEWVEVEVLLVGHFDNLA